MADELVAVLVEDISRLLTSHLNLVISEAKDELQMLKKDLWLLKAFLCEAEQAAGLRELDLDRQIKEVVYDVEDTLESWLMQKAAKNKISMSMQGYALAREIESIRDRRLEPVNRRIRTYRDLQIVQKQPTEANEIRWEQLYTEVPSIKLNNIFEDEADTIISNLMEETEQLDVISITGMPGIGKTTLARKIYQDKKIQKKFPTRIWVDIPLDFCSKDLYLNIIKEFNPRGSCSKDSCQNEFDESGRINDDKLMDAVRACLEKSRFLLVMDAVWTADTLESIIRFLPKNGKVLITSRHNHITRKPHLLRFLTEKESWELLQLAVFGKLDECTGMLKSTGECIAKNCDGSPLAIAVLANSLMVPSEAANDLTEKWWKKVSENVTMYVTDYCAHHNVFKSIELSYIKLPRCLRNCFLYLGVFPEGHEIPVWTLTRLWIAEGLVQDGMGLTLEETVERNLYDLVNRNLVVVGKTYPNGQIKTCRLHKLIYGFCKHKAAEQDFYHEIKMSKGGALDGPMPLTPNHRRLCIYSCLSEFLSSGPKGPCVRSILCLNKAHKEVLQSKYSSNIHKSFKLLKIFECKSIEFAKFPTKLSKLMNLRYISLSCDDIDIIPEAISSLCYLETLVVDTQSPSLELKANIWRMFQLQHLVTKAAIVLAIRGEGEAGKNLQTLTRLAPRCCTEDVFRRVPNLKRLGIQGQLAALLSAESLSKLECLEHLKLINESAPDSQLHGRLHPQCFPPNIKSLTLSATYLGWECMSILGKIDSLEILKLKNNAITGGSWITDANGFRGLVFLLIRTTDLASWEASSADCFSRLKWLVLKNCEQLEEIPLTLAKSLDTLDVEYVSESAVKSARKIKQEIARRQGQTT